MKVQVYATETCSYCKMEKAYLEQLGVEYEAIMVDKDREKAQEMVELSGQMGVPFTVITNEQGEQTYILGFNKPALDAALGLTVN